MNKIKVSEASGPVLDYLVAKCEGDEPFTDGISWIIETEGHYWQLPEYSTNWAYGGPIIEREEIFLAKSILGGWTGSIMTHDERVRCTLHEAPTPLIAAMRCYVASEMGDEVEVPEELK